MADAALAFPLLVGLIAVALLFDFLNPMQGFRAETGGAITLFMTTWHGVPVSTAHTITGAIVGVGAARRTTAVRWNVGATS